MTTLVELRRWRIEADIPDAEAARPEPSASPKATSEAEIILFPKIARALAGRPRKTLKRRQPAARLES